MKKKIAKSLLMGAVTIALSANAFAQEVEDIDNVILKEQAVESVTEIENADVDRSKARELELSNERKKEMSQVSRLDSLTAKASQGALELQILQQDLDRKALEAQLKEDEFQSRLDKAMTALSMQFQEREKEYQNTIDSLQNELRRQRHLSAKAEENAKEILAASKKTENNVFVTNVVGVGSNLTASVYYEDKIIDVREGMVLSPELSVMEIMPNGVVFKDGKKESFVALTNEEYAFSKTFNKDAAKLLEANFSSQAQGNRGFR